MSEETPAVPTEPVTDTPTVKEIVKPVPVGFDAVMLDIKQNGTAAQKNLINALSLYVSNMSPHIQQTDDGGAKQQYNLWKAIQTVIEQSEPNEFKKLWNIILAYFQQYKQSVFHDRYIYRYSEFWQWSEDHLTALQRLINIIKLTSDPATRAVGLRKVSLDRSLEVGISDAARQKLTNFYKG